MKLKLDVEGLNETQSSISKYDKALKEVLPPAVKKGADHLRNDVKRRINERTGMLASAIEADNTWVHPDAPKAFAGVGVNETKVGKLRGTSKRTGKDYSIPSAVEYGHRAPGGGGYTVLATDKEGNYVTYNRGRKKGRLKAAASSKQNKVAKPQKFMQKAYKDQGNRAAVIKYVNDAVKKVIR